MTSPLQTITCATVRKAGTNRRGHITIIFLLAVLPLLDSAIKQPRSVKNKCHQHCVFTLVESIPEGMSYRNWSTPYPSTYDVWKGMLSRATSTVEIAAYYFSLVDGEEKESGFDKSEDIFNDLINAKSRGLNVRIVQNPPTKYYRGVDTEILAQKGAAEVRTINMKRLVGSGIFHTKLWLVDRREAYVGSANPSRNALTQRNELGIHISNCTCLLQEYGKIFDAYWEVGLPDAVIPSKWPANLSTDFNEPNPMRIAVNDNEAGVYLSSSPSEMCPDGWESDIQSILTSIGKANHFIYVTLTDYLPLKVYGARLKYWPVIDDALKAAAIDRRVRIKLLICSWMESLPGDRQFLKSLTILSETYENVSISAKFFVIPHSLGQGKMPSNRVHHDKYMVTDNIAYVGTSNWTEDYFVDTTGVGTVIGGNTTLRQQLEELFLRDWNSEFASPV